MKKNIVKWQLAGFVTVSILGTLLHFLYDWTNINFTALFSAVNESTWEHMKLIFFPMLLFALIQNKFIGKEYNGFWCIKLRGTLTGLILIPVLFYTLRGVFGTTPDWINVTIFFVATAIAYIYEAKQFKKENLSCLSDKAAFIILLIIALAFALFTFFPPHIPLFQDPIDKGFGLQ